MHSIAINNDTGGGTLLKNSVSSVRPDLSIDTNIKKKKWNNIFSSREKTKFDCSTTKDSENCSSLPTPQTLFTESPASGNSSMRHLDTLKALSSTEDKPRSIDSANVHNNKSVHCVFKKLLVPHFHRSATPSSAPRTVEDSRFDPVAPEPIMPPLVYWSPEALSPPPWELQDHQEKHAPIRHTDRNKRHSMGFQNLVSASIFDREYDDEDEDDSIATLDSTNAADCHSDSEIGTRNKLNNRTTNLDPSNSIDRTSDVTRVGSTLPTGRNLTDPTRIRRSSSCPTYDTLSLSSTSASSISNTLVDNDIISITEQHTRHMPVFKKYTHPANKKSALKACKKAKALAANRNSFYSSFCEESLKYLYIPNVFDPVTRESVLEFSIIKPRKYQLHRKTSWKREAKALMAWHHTLEEYIQKPPKIPTLSEMSPDKQARNKLTRKFILREFFTTEVSFWNQLYYSKIIFYDALVRALANGNQFIKESDADPFANLFDLMQFSAKLINRLRHFQHIKETGSPIIPISAADEIPNPTIDCDNFQLGKALCDMAEELVVFLRCALDYKENRKILDNNRNNKEYMRYRQKLSSRKETSQFEMTDYLIIPIQRVARYGLLISDLIKHCEPTHRDYKDLLMSHNIVTSLASAMNSVQKKKKS